MVVRLQENSDSVFKQINDAKDNVSESVEKATVAKQKIEGIVHSIETMHEVASQIAAETEQQVAVTESVADRAQPVGKNVVLTYESGKQTALATEKQAVLSEKLQKLASAFKV